MYVCSCSAVSSRIIIDLARRGVSSVEEVGRISGAGTVCGQCQPTIVELLRQAGAVTAGLPAPPGPER